MLWNGGAYRWQRPDLQFYMLASAARAALHRLTATHGGSAHITTPSSRL